MRLLQSRTSNHFASIDTGLFGFKTRHNLAQLDLDEGNLTEAETHWLAALAEQKGFAPARHGLADIYRRQGRWGDLEGMAHKLAG